uniref:Putative secreted protein n=2 Tax=Ixodes ricinus TaxID=34613 RepID=V5HBV4_IXORI
MGLLKGVYCWHILLLHLAVGLMLAQDLFLHKVTTDTWLCMCQQKNEGEPNVLADIVLCTSIRGHKMTNVSAFLQNCLSRFFFFVVMG